MRSCVGERDSQPGGTLTASKSSTEMTPTHSDFRERVGRAKSPSGQYLVRRLMGGEGGKPLCQEAAVVALLTSRVTAELTTATAATSSPAPCMIPVPDC